MVSSLQGPQAEKSGTGLCDLGSVAHPLRERRLSGKVGTNDGIWEAKPYRVVELLLPGCLAWGHTFRQGREFSGLHLAYY